MIPNTIPGVHPQPLLPGEAERSMKICEGSKQTQATCAALPCCEWDGQDCHYMSHVCSATTDIFGVKSGHFSESQALGK